MTATDPVQAVADVVQSRAISIEDAWAVLAAARPAIEREAKAAAWDEGVDAGHQAARAVNPEWPEQPTNPYRADRMERIEREVTTYAGYEDCDHCGAINVDDLMAERDTLAARLAAVEELVADPPVILNHGELALRYSRVRAALEDQ